MKKIKETETGLYIDNSQTEVKVYTPEEFEQLRKQHWLVKFLGTLNIKFQNGYK